MRDVFFLIIPGSSCCIIRSTDRDLCAGIVTVPVIYFAYKKNKHKSRRSCWGKLESRMNMENNEKKVVAKTEGLNEVAGGVNYSVFYQCTSCGEICGCDTPNPPPCNHCGGTIWVPYAGPFEVNE